MTNRSSKIPRSNWWLPLGLLVVGLGLFIPLSLFDQVFGSIVYWFAVVPFISLFFLRFAKSKIRQRPSVFLTLIIYWGMSWALTKNVVQIRADLRWLFEAKEYKAEVLKQPYAPDGEFKHVEWDGWGFPGAGDTVMYLVFDPQDSLSAASKSKAPGKFRGISCAVFQVNRLESHWYTVRFYTDTEWGRCT
jgi:hypothetical protein